MNAPNNFEYVKNSKMEELQTVLSKNGFNLTASERAIFHLGFATGVETLANKIQPRLSELELELAKRK